MARKSAALLVCCMLLLLALGFIMQISIGPFTIGSKGDPYAEVKRQMMFAGIGVFLLWVMLKVDYRRLAQWSWVIFGVTALLLGLCLIPGIGMEINGARRWIRFPGGAFQPSEFAKISGILSVAAWCARHPEQRQTFSKGFAIPLVIAGVLVMLIAVEIDLGNAALLSVGALAVIYAAGARLRFLVLSILPIAGGFGAAILFLPERMGRFLAFMDLEKYRAGDGLQQFGCLIAYASGGITGQGVGNSRQKMGALPYANSDMISAIIGEEFGGLFCLGMIVVYSLLCVAGFFIAIHAPDRFGKLLGFGLVSLLATQTFIHLGVTTALLPNKGMPLPFVSAGGSNLICLMFAVGILLNIHKQGMQMRSQDVLLGRAKFTPAL